VDYFDKMSLRLLNHETICKIIVLEEAEFLSVERTQTVNVSFSLYCS